MYGLVGVAAGMSVGSAAVFAATLSDAHGRAAAARIGRITLRVAPMAGLALAAGHGPWPAGELGRALVVAAGAAPVLHAAWLDYRRIRREGA
jgi:hypothetical protein